MQIQTTFTPKSLTETTRHSRNWVYWPAQVLGSMRALAYLIALFVFAVDRIYKALTTTPINQHDLGVGILILAAIAALVAILYYRTQRKRAKALASLTPLTFHMESSGLKIADTHGANAFEPWSTFTDFQLKKHTIVLKRTNKKTYRTIPTDTLPPHEVAQLRAILLSHLPERP